MRKSGFHVQRTSNQLKEAIFNVKPTMCVSLAHDREFWNEVKSGMYLMGRRYEGAGFDFRNVNPERWAEQCAALNMPYDAFTTPNEPAGNDISPDDAARLDDFCCRFRWRLLELGYEAVGPNIATGNWHGDAIVRYMPNWCQEARFIGLHEYSARAMWDQNPKLERPPHLVPKNEGDQIGRWYMLRYRDWYNAIIEKWPGKKHIQMVITECGVAYGVIPDERGQPKYGDVGWRTDMTEEQYGQGLLWYFDEEMNEDDYCLGGAIFMVGHDDHAWQSFETLHIWPVLMGVREVEMIESPPEEPVEEGKMEIKVVDMDYQERDFDWAEEKYGVAFRRAVAAPGRKVYRLIELWEKRGPASLITQVLDENGHPIPDQNVAFYWPNAPDPPDPPTEVCSHDWHRNFVHGVTNAEGDHGPGMGKKAYHGIGEGGPHAVWVRDPNIPSDICEKLGMLAGTPHDHLDQKFKLMIEPAGEWGGGFALVEKRWDPTEGMNFISVQHDGSRNFFGTVADLLVGNDPGNPDWTSPEPIERLTDDSYYFHCEYEPIPGEQSRNFWVRFRIAPDGMTIGTVGPFEYKTTGPGRIWHAVTAWVPEGEEPPGLPPELEPEPPLEPSAGWMMEIERVPAPGLRLLIGVLPMANVSVTLSGWGEPVILVSGSKPEYGLGGFETPIWGASTYAISFMDVEFQVEIGNNEAVKCVFTEPEEPLIEEARLVSGWLLREDAEELLQELEDVGFEDMFNLEERA